MLLPTLAKYRKTLNDRQIVTENGDILTVNTTMGDVYVADGQGRGVGFGTPSAPPLLTRRPQAKPAYSVQTRTIYGTIAIIGQDPWYHLSTIFSSKLSGVDWCDATVYYDSVDPDTLDQDIIWFIGDAIGAIPSGWDSALLNFLQEGRIVVITGEHEEDFGSGPFAKARNDSIDALCTTAFGFTALIRRSYYSPYTIELTDFGKLVFAAYPPEYPSTINYITGSACLEVKGTSYDAYRLAENFIQKDGPAFLWKRSQLPGVYSNGVLMLLFDVDLFYNVQERAQRFAYALVNLV